MPRALKGAARRQAKKRFLKDVRGHRGSKSIRIRLVKTARIRQNVNARIGRKQKKRQYRAMWIVRLSAACKQRGIRYSEFINGCKKANIQINRKMLSEIAIADAAAFDAIAEKAMAAL